MSDPDFFKGRTIAIAGLGLMGGSLALALRGCGAEIRAFDPSPATIFLANQTDAVTAASISPDEILHGADLVILSAPVRAILQLLELLPQVHTGSAIILDIGSTKKTICLAMDRLPERFQAVGGHPMCGGTAAGLVHARQDLFKDAIFALSATARTTLEARDTAEALVDLLQARPLWIDPDLHDRWVAATSHLPYLISLGLALATPEEAAPLAGPGFRSTARLAESSVSMMLDTLMTNPGNVLAALRQFRQDLDGIEQILEAESEDRLREIMIRGANRLAHFVPAV